MESRDQQDLIEYLAQIIPSATVECAGCGVMREVDAAIVRDDKFYCKEECADRANAVLRKAQPPCVKAGGYMDV